MILNCHIHHVNNVKHAKTRHSVKIYPTKKQNAWYIVDGVGSRSNPMVTSALVVLNFVFRFIQTQYGLQEGPTTFFQKSKKATSKFQTPEWYHNSGVT